MRQALDIRLVERLDRRRHRAVEVARRLCLEAPQDLHEKGEVLTGLLYLAPDAEDLHSHLNTYETAFNKLAEKDLCPGAGMLEKINAALR